MKTKLFSLFIVSSLLFTCKKAEQIEPTKFQIENQFKGYFNNFINEAILRNIKIDTSNLILIAGKVLSKSKETCGTCYVNVKNPKVQKTIEIYTDSPNCWLLKTLNAREALVFHELGHCLLDRDHRSDTFADGSPKSIMYVDNTDLYSPCVYAIDDSNLCNKTDRRKYYIDELFDSKTEKPSWAN